jgi:putative ABC transport system permease protein
VLIVGNVVSGAVVSGFRHIGILKALGFTPSQVVAVYLVMVSVPALVGCVLGTVIGVLATQPLLAEAFEGLGLGGGIGASAWVLATGLIGVPTLAALAALVPAARAYRLSAAEAISAGSAPRTGRGLRVQRRLSGSGLPRSVSLGLGLPLARPGRTALTVAAVLLGVTTVTFATGLSDTLSRVAALSDQVSGDVLVQVPGRMMGPAGMDPVGQPTTRTDAEIEALLRDIPHAARVAAMLNLPVSVVGQSQPLVVNFARGDVADLGYRDQLLAGRWMAGPGEGVAPTEVLRQRGLAVGDRLTLELGDRRSELTIVGQIMRPAPGPGAGVLADWGSLADLAPDYRAKPDKVLYQVQLDAGADAVAYAAAVGKADPGLHANAEGNEFEFQVIVVSFSTVLALLLAAIAALGVLNTVALNVHERRRDLGMLKSIGMTPRQVVTMVVTSMAALGAVGGLIGIPVGIVAHRVVVPLAADAAQVMLPASVLQVWEPWILAGLALAGVVIAVLGALLPARAAARLTIATVLHNE